jgi:hypothetical protein
VARGRGEIKKESGNVAKKCGELDFCVVFSDSKKIDSKNCKK